MIDLRPRAMAILFGIGLLGCSFFAFGCGAPSAPRAGRLDEARAARALDVGAPPGAATAPPSRAPASAPTVNGSGPLKPAPIVAGFVREIEQPVTAVALDKPPHVAALGANGVLIHDTKGWRTQALPKSLSGVAERRLELFYGRDYRVRVVGTHRASDGVRSVYLRSLPDGLKAAPDELGRLGNSQRGALVAVLGTADPEVVCRPGDVCLIKRVTGWTTLPADAALSHAAVSAGSGWVLAGNAVFRAERDWVKLEPSGPWQKARGLFGIGDRVFVTEDSSARLFELVEGAWRALEAPVGRVTCLWGMRRDGFWIAGDSGVAYYDGRGFRLVSGAPPGTLRILGRSESDVWLAGVSGLYRLSAFER